MGRWRKDDYFHLYNSILYIILIFDIISLLNNRFIIYIV